MTSTLLNVSITILLKAICGAVGVIVALYIKNKKQAEVVKLGATTYNYRTTVARQIFLQVEQLYKLTPGSGELKAALFDKLILAKFPSLTEEKITHFREAATGFFNAQVKTLLAPAYDPSKDDANVVVDETPAKIEPIAENPMNPLGAQAITNQAPQNTAPILGV